MRFPPALVASALIAVALGGCGGSLPSSSRSTGAEAARLVALTDLDQKVGRVAWALSRANTELCPVVRQSAGWALHAANQYSLDLRPEAEARFSLRGDLPGVLVAPSDSPAAAAGVRAGDLILAVNGQPLSAGELGRPPRFEGFAANLADLDSALAAGPVTLMLERSGDQTEVRLQPQTACGYDVQLNPSDDFRARADGRRLFISTALAGFTQSDDELALILGHELAHNVLQHRSWSETGGEGRTVVDRDCPPGLCDSDPERQADRVGLFLMARAGYSPDAAAPFWRRYAASNWRVRYPQLTHASAGVRAARLEEVRAEIETLRAEGRPLTP